MTGEMETVQMLKGIGEICPKAGIVLTLGEDGAICIKERQIYR